MFSVEDFREFSHLSIGLKVSSVLSIPTLLARYGFAGLRLLRTSPRLAYCLAQVADTESTLESMGWKTRLSEFGLEVSSDSVRLHKLLCEERSSGYAPGVGLNSGQLILYSLIRSMRPDLVVETGVASGVSSYFILSALANNRNGRLVSVDLPNLTNEKGYVNSDGVIDNVYTPPDRGIGWVVPESLRSRWQLLLGRSMDVLPTLPLKPDLFLHDSDHSYRNMMEEFVWAHGSGARVILSDDIHWNRAWNDFVESQGLHHTEVANLGISFK